MQIPFQRKLRIQFLKWHRTIGLFSAFFAIFIVLTGILLNHGNDLELDQVPVPQSFLSFYGISVEPPTAGYAVGENWIVEVHGLLYFDSNAVGNCEGLLAGALPVEDGVLAVCQGEIYLFTVDGQIIEKLSQLQEPIKKLGTKSKHIILSGVEQAYQFDLNEFALARIEGDVLPGSVEWLEDAELPESVASTLVSEVVVSEITWERFLLDVHSGRLFGNFGVFLVDLVGIAILLLAFSGVWLRLSRPGRK